MIQKFSILLIHKTSYIIYYTLYICKHNVHCCYTVDHNTIQYIQVAMCSSYTTCVELAGTMVTTCDDVIVELLFAAK